MPKSYTLPAETGSLTTVGSSATLALKEVVTQDLEAQKRAAEFALAEARKIEAVLAGPETHNPLLKEAKDALVNVARLLAANTTAMSTAVLDIVGPRGKPK